MHVVQKGTLYDWLAVLNPWFSPQKVNAGWRALTCKVTIAGMLTLSNIILWRHKFGKISMQYGLVMSLANDE